MLCINRHSDSLANHFIYLTTSHGIQPIRRQENDRLTYIMLYIYVKMYHDNVIKRKHFPRYWSFVRGIHLSPLKSPHKGRWRGALIFSLICVWINGRVNNREAGDLRRYRARYDVSVIILTNCLWCLNTIYKRLRKYSISVLQINGIGADRINKLNGRWHGWND